MKRMPDAQDILNRVALDEQGCWVWQQALFHNGYAMLRAGGQTKRAHRISYELLVGPIPAGLVIDHLCRNRRCCNPAHMEPVTNEENVLRGRVSRGLAA